MIDVIVLPFLLKRFISEFVFYIGIVELCDYCTHIILCIIGDLVYKFVKPYIIKQILHNLPHL